MATFEERLAEALKNKKMKQIDLAKKLNLNRAVISQYLSGRYKPKYDRITELAHALDVDEGWLMGYDVNVQYKENIQETSDSLLEKPREEIDILFDKYRDVLTEGDIAIMKTVMLSRKKQIDEELGEK